MRRCYRGRSFRGAAVLEGGALELGVQGGGVGRCNRAGHTGAELNSPGLECEGLDGQGCRGAAVLEGGALGVWRCGGAGV